jgi:hypothetical protein
MLKRGAIVLSFAVLVTGCASETPQIASFTTTSALAVATPLPVAAAAEAPAPVARPRKTMSDRVLTAIALERVTGLKPDPARFRE